jgi:hypothetical protein
VATLHISLEEGFQDDAVEIKVDGRTVFDKADLRTRLQIGLADSFETDVPNGEHEIELVVPARGISETFSVDPRDTPNVGISLEEQNAKVRFSKQPFGYV